MDPWVYAVAAVALAAAALVCALGVRSGRRRRAQLHRELIAAQRDVLALTERLDSLTAEVAQTRLAAREQATRQEIAPYVITGIVESPEPDATPRQAEIVHAIETSRPVWLPAKPLRETLVRTVALAHGLRRALDPDNRDRIRLEMQAEIRRSRRQRKAELKAVKKYLRDRRRSAA